MSGNKGSPVTFNTGCAINRDMYYIAASPDAWTEMEDISSSYTVMFIYQNQTEEKWFYHELPGWSVESTCFPEPNPDDVRKAYALSEEGEIECYSRNGSVKEKITDAGISENGPNYGYVNRMRKIGNTFYVCGLGGQVYKRTAHGWKHFDEGLLQPSLYSKPSSDITDDERATYIQRVIDAVDSDTTLLDINGSHNDIYVVGMKGFVAHHNGLEWRILKRVTAAHLNAIHIISEQEVWIAGSNGTVLQGNAKDGFKVLSRKTLETDFYAITHFNGEIYISGEDGIYVFRNGKPERQKISDRANLKGVSCIEAKDGVLWALSEKKLLRLVGEKWEIFEHPNNV
jgi:hypothetical protein